MKPTILLAAEAPSVFIAARLYIGMGLSILPCTGKRPALTEWSHLQKRIAAKETVNLWASTGLLQNVGVICGDVSGGLVVMDLDGEEAINAFGQRFPLLQETYTVRSGSGHGMHLYYRVQSTPHTTRVIGLEIGNIELRSNGTYVVAPPSIHPDSGKPYTVAYRTDIMALDNMAPVVEWIKSLIKAKHGGTMPQPSNRKPVEHMTAYGRVALAGECAKVVASFKGNRNAVLYEAALRMGSLITDGKLDRSTVERALFEAAVALSATDGESATRRTIDSGINAGMENSRERYKNA